MAEPSAESIRPVTALREMQQMWLSLMRGSWSSLVVVPADPADPANSARAVAGALVEVAQLEQVEPFHIIDASGASPARGEQLAHELASVVASGLRAVVIVDSLIHSLGGVPLVRDADVALLIVRLSVSNFDSVQSTIDIVGRDRILGAVAMP